MIRMKTYTVKQAAEITGLNPETIRRYIRAGRIAAEKVRAKGFKTEYAISESELLKINL